MVRRSGRDRTVSFRVRKPIYEVLESLPRGIRSKILRDLTEKWYEGFSQYLEAEAGRLETRAKQLRDAAGKETGIRTATRAEAKRAVEAAARSLKPEARVRFTKTPIGKTILSEYHIGLEQVGEWAKIQ